MSRDQGLCVKQGMPWVVAACVLIWSLPSTSAVAAGAQPAPEAIAGALVPLLKDARATRQPQLTIEPGTLPPSPITGRNSTLAAVTIAKRHEPLAPEVDAFIDRLLTWNPKEPLPASDRETVIDWIGELRIAVVGRLAAREKGVDCDDECLVAHFTKPGPLFGDSDEEQVQTRNEVLLETLSEAVLQ